MRYAVREPATVSDAERLEDNWGLTDHKTQEVLLKPGQAPDTLADTVLHEVLHCCWFNSGAASKFSKDDEEFAVRSLSPLLLDTLRRNPRLVAFLVGAG